MNPKEPKRREVATFAGGCFWCIQHEFDLLPGVLATTVGYTGGLADNPTYADVCSGTTGHVEALQIVFDPSRISYQRLLEIYWRTIDPTTREGQFCDLGSQYRPIIFYHSEQQRQEAVNSKRALLEDKAVSQILVDVVPACPFFPAETYHQQYYKKSQKEYERYHAHSGRKQRLKEIWGVDR